ncbi:hypothetical protein BJ170DRAFT_677048 [Xylariales sp. AK1849]|nr:hypothetical protein BJ170DRAFT_677048 [Xylariales sp. AK1849]
MAQTQRDAFHDAESNGPRNDEYGKDDVAPAPIGKKPARKRARRACLGCRARKVRCDTTSHGTPCTNCGLDDLECVIKPRARKWLEAEPDLYDQQKPADTLTLLDRKPPGLSCDILSRTENILDQMEDFPFPGRTGAFGSILQHESTNKLDTSVYPDLRPSTGAIGRFVLFAIYPFIDAGTLWQLSPVDISFLDQRGCFHLPAKPTLDEFVKQYFLHVHSIIPLLNEAEFWAMYTAEMTALPAEHNISLFVFQAMLFISCPYVNASTLQRLGFSSVPRARAEFYSRAKFLFDIHRQNGDDVASAQGALMLTYHVPDINDRTGALWLDTAIHFARSAQADHYSELEESFPEKATLKRLWWCCVLRDRIMALVYGGLCTFGPKTSISASQASWSVTLKAKY